MKGTILVCGGAGYIGSHMVRLLRDEGRDCLVLDDLSTGHPDAVSKVQLLQVNLLDRHAVARVFEDHPIDAVMHFAAKSIVSESVANPLAYHENNICGALSLLSAMRDHGVGKIIFSSTAAVYGHPSHTPITEDHPLCPINPYGETKAHVESVLRDVATAHDIRSVSLRYFNAAGAHPQACLGERHQPETHLIPNLLTALQKGEKLSVFGDDYPTPDGTCIRDYIHVQDICRAHLLALKYLESHPGAHAFNLGSGRGYSVKEIIDVAVKVTGKPAAFTVKPRRPGDPAILTASFDAAQSELGWRPDMSGIEDIVETAWQWHCRTALCSSD